MSLVIFTLRPAVSPRCPLRRSLNELRFGRNPAQNTKSPFPLGNELRFAGHITSWRSLGDLLAWQRWPCCLRWEALSTEVWSQVQTVLRSLFADTVRSSSPSSTVHVSNTERPLKHRVLTNYCVKTSTIILKQKKLVHFMLLEVFLRSSKTMASSSTKRVTQIPQSPDYLTQGWPKTW